MRNRLTHRAFYHYNSKGRDFPVLFFQFDKPGAALFYAISLRYHLFVICGLSLVIRHVQQRCMNIGIHSFHWLLLFTMLCIIRACAFLPSQPSSLRGKVSCIATLSSRNILYFNIKQALYQKEAGPYRPTVYTVLPLLSVLRQPLSSNHPHCSQQPWQLWKLPPSPARR